MMFTGAANLAVSPAGELIMQANLNSLMYDGLADFDGAKRAFQTDLGEKPTEVLSIDWTVSVVS